MGKVTKNTYVNELDSAVKGRVRKKLEKALVVEGYTGGALEESVENGLDGRLADLEDTIDIKEFLG